MSKISVLKANWNAPESVFAFTTSTLGGVSEGDYSTLNLGTHVGDNTAHVAENRRRLQHHVGESVSLCWLNQTHSDIIVDANNYKSLEEGDACIANKANYACIAMTADCLPVLLCNEQGQRVGALHCGWRGLQQNLIGKTITKYFQNDNVIAWLGPAIGAKSYEVDDFLYQRFVNTDAQYAEAFAGNRDGHFLMNIYHIARIQLARAGVSDNNVFGGDFDTFTDERFFSHRRNSQSGRMASVIYLG